MRFDISNYNIAAYTKFEVNPAVLLKFQSFWDMNLWSWACDAWGKIEAIFFIQIRIQVKKPIERSVTLEKVREV
jgi:hypothetical protein